MGTGTIFFREYAGAYCWQLLHNLERYNSVHRGFSSSEYANYHAAARRQYKNITLPFLKSLPRDMFVLPGHGPEFRMADVYHGAVHVEFVGV